MSPATRPTRSPRRDRHGRGARGPLFFPGTPAWRTRRQHFDLLVAETAPEIIGRWPAVGSIEFAVEDVPPSDPAPWEDPTVLLGRVFPADGRRGLRDRIVVYRRGVEQHATKDEIPFLLRSLLIERISQVVDVPPEELDVGRA